MISNSLVTRHHLVDEPGVAQALRVMLVAMFASALAISVFTQLLGWRHAPQLALVASASSLVALGLSRSGRMRVGLLLPLVTITYAVLHLAARSGGIENTGLAILPVLIMMGTLVLDRPTVIFFTSATLLAVVVMLAIRYFVLRAEPYSTNDLGDFFIFALTCGTAALVGRLLVSRIEEGFRLVRTSESRFRNIFENIQDVYCEMRKDGTLLELSPAGAGLFGVAREDMIGRSIATVCVHQSEFDGFVAALVEHGRVSNHELVIRDSCAALVPVLVNASLQREADVGEERIIGSIRDITERKRLEEELRRRAEELQKVMDFAPVALFTAHDSECREVTVNRMGNVILELPEGANSSAKPGGPIPPYPFFRDGIEVPVHELPLQMAAQGADVRDSELEARLPSGRRRLLWGHASPLRDATGRVRGAIAAFQDITETRERTDALLRESEERFRNTADAAPVIIWFDDTQRRVTFVNEQCIRFTGLPAEQLLGDGWAQVLHPDDLEAVRKTYCEGVDTRASYQLEYRARRADGEYRHMLGTTRPRYIGSEYAGQVGSVIDITELKRAQEEASARQKLESVGTLASGIAHDFNNLLGGVLAQAELAQSEYDAGSSPNEELKVIRELATRGSEIVGQLMIYAGKETAVFQLVDVSQVVEETLAFLKVTISKRAALEIDLSKDLPPVRGSAAQLRRIVMNLVANASEALGEGDGEIRVTTRRVIVGQASAISKGLAEGDYLQLQVSDTGHGMSPEKQASVFDPFFTTKSAGRGLGLAIVQGIVRGLRGAIHLASEPGKGTTFQILLPCVEASSGDAGSIPGVVDPARPLEQATILIVEDEEPLRQAVGKMLRKTGFEVLEAVDGASAISLLRARGNEIDVILLDKTIPGPSSHEVMAMAGQVRPDLKVILTSAYSEEMAMANMTAPQIRGFIRKPFQLGDLVQMLRNVLSS